MTPAGDGPGSTRSSSPADAGHRDARRPHRPSRRGAAPRHVDGDGGAAFGELVRRHRDRLWAVALRTLGDREEAADAVQEALLSASGGPTPSGASGRHHLAAPDRGQRLPGPDPARTARPCAAGTAGRARPARPATSGRVAELRLDVRDGAGRPARGAAPGAGARRHAGPARRRGGPDPRRGGGHREVALRPGAGGARPRCCASVTRRARGTIAARRQPLPRRRNQGGADVPPWTSL